MHNFTPVPALIGGMLMGLAGSALLLLNGRISGVSGIFGGVLKPIRGEFLWRLLFVVGLALGAVIAIRLVPATPIASGPIRLPVALVAASGVLVGFGARLGNGCTSGHGMCGMARLSKRSIAFTATFFATGAIAIFIARHLVGA